MHFNPILSEQERHHATHGTAADHAKLWGEICRSTGVKLMEDVLPMVLILRLALAVGCVLMQNKVAPQPLMPFKTFRGEVGFVLASVGFGWASFGIWLYYIWQLFLLVRHHTPLETAAHFFPTLPLGLVATGLTRYLVHSIRPAYVLISSMAAFTLGLILLTVALATQTYWALTFLSLLIIPSSIDVSSPSLTITLSNAFPRDMQGIASSPVTAVVNYNVSLGLGFATTVEVHTNNGGATPNGILKGFKGVWYRGGDSASLGSSRHGIPRQGTSANSEIWGCE